MEIFTGNTETVKFVDPETKKARDVKLDDLRDLAEANQEDIILLSDNGEMPIVTLGDYNKIIFDKKKKEKENLKKQKENVHNLKEIRMSSTIAENDIKIKAKNINKFLNNGDKVLITIKYKGRAARGIGDAQSKVDQILQFITEDYVVNDKLSINNNIVSIVLLPSTKK